MSHGPFANRPLKETVRLVATSNVTPLSGVGQVIDGKTVVAGDRLLLAGQTTTSANGIYVASAGAWSRSADLSSSEHAKRGVLVVTSADGGTLGSSLWAASPSSTFALGTDAFSFTQIASPLSSSSPTTVDRSAASAGTSPNGAREDHKHDVSTAGPTALTVGGSNVTGTAASLARSDHVHSLPAFGTAAGTFCQGNDSRLSDDRTTNGVRGPSGIAVITPITSADGMLLAATSSVSANWSYLAPIQDALTYPASFQAGTLSNTTAFLATNTRAVYVGRVPYRGASSWFDRINLTYRVTTAAATITYCEIGLGISSDSGVSTYLTGTNVNITRIASLTANSVYDSVAVKGATFDGIQALVTPGQDLWVLFSAQATTAPQVRAGLADDLGVGFHRTAAVRLSTMAANTAFAKASSSEPIPFVALAFGYPP